MKKYIFMIFLIFSAPSALLARLQPSDGFFFQIYHSGFFNLVHGGIRTDINAAASGPYKKDNGNKYRYGIKFGKAIKPNWLVHINFDRISYPNITGEETSRHGGMYDYKGTYTLSGLAFGASYYMPNDIYLSPELRLGTTSVIAFQYPKVSHRRLESIARGGGYGFTLGKEWWANAEWTWGLALFYHKDDLKTTGVKIVDGSRRQGIAYDRVNFTHIHYGIIFTATYN